MTLEYIPNKTRQVGDNVTVSFSFLFKIFSGKEATDLKVYKIDKSTTPETQGSALTYGVDYTVVLSTTVEGGTVTYTVAPTLTEDAFIIREVDYKQETELKPNNKFNEVAIENSFDKDAMVNSQLLEQTERTIKVSEIYTGGADFTLPNPEASKVLGWDETGLIMANYSGSDLDTILTTSYGQQLVQSADALGARNVLGLGIADDVEFNDITANDIEVSQITATTYVGLPDSSETVKGVIELATQAETNTGTDYVRAITPLKYTQAHQTCKAWVQFDGSNGAISDAFNVSGVVRNSAGNYTVSFTNNMPDTNFCVVLGCRSDVEKGTPNYHTKAVGSVVILNRLTTVYTATDLELCSVAIFSTF